MAKICVHIALLIIVLVATLFISLAAAEEPEGEKDKVIIEIVSPPPEDCERKSKRHDQLTIEYTGTLTESGKQFDSSHDRKQPFVFQLGGGQVIKGWEEGLDGMCVGEQRKLIIPSSKAYGERGAGELIPPNAGLTFLVELIKIEDGTPPPNIFKMIDADNDMQLSRLEVQDYLDQQSAKVGSIPGDKSEQMKIVDDIFNHEDVNKDGFISHDEFSGPKHDEL